MNKQHLVLFVCVFMFFSTNAQLLIKNDGRAYFGPVVLPNEDLGNVLSMSIQGKHGIYNAGSKLAFGDFGSYVNRGWNVFVGEYGTHDSDALWLHGKKGFNVTAFNGRYLVGEWKYNGYSLPRITTYDGVRVDRLAVSSDDGHKRNVETIRDALLKILFLEGLKYDYQLIDNDRSVGDTGIMPESNIPKMKEESDPDRASSVIQQRQNGDKRYGFRTSTIMALFPEIVELDSLGNQYVNYLEMMPILVTAIKELYINLRSNGLIMDVDESYNDYLSRLQADSISDGQTRMQHGYLTINAELFQNMPNPFSTETVIRYRIPFSASSATLFVFNLIGELLQSYPISVFGEGQVTINGSTFSAGMYIYSLVVDGQIVDNKRMILTK